MIESVLIGFALCLANALAAWFVIEKAYRGDKAKIIKIVLGSMVVRYFIVATAVWFCLQVLTLDHFAFALTFLLSTFLLIILEILYLNYRSNFLNLQNRLTK